MNTPQAKEEKVVKELTAEEIEKKKRREEMKKAKNAAKNEKFKKKQEAQQQQQQKNNLGKAKKENKKQTKEKEEIKFNKTIKGEKKRVIEPMPNTYSPKYVEEGWYEWWEKEGFFKPEYSKRSGKKFVMVIPPPNVTGKLHLGHALTNSIQDTIVRYHRMKGDETLWVPGVDHAGIATQVVVEKKLMREQGVTRHDIGREKFLEEVWKWKDEYGKGICNQLRRLGSSLDWSREVFTMDEKRGEAVKEAFCRFYEKGLLYREQKLVNWCCTLKTAISDIEVEYIDVSKPTAINVPGYEKPIIFGNLHEFAYPLVNPATGKDEGEILIDTTRIETMLGDVCVCIHSKDERYKKYHGWSVRHPFNGKILPIIEDDELVDMEFGTGCVKVTPAHDPNDYNVAIRHKLKIINILNDDGTMNQECGEFAGMKRFECREAVIEKLKEKGLYKGVKASAMRVPICSRSHDIIEPRIKPQWWVNCKNMARRAVEAVRKGELKMYPSEMENVWYRWLENIHDWCISRQLWWGHRIPAYLIKSKKEKEADEFDMKNWVVARSEEEARKKAAEIKGVNIEDIELKQDPDVLDTWFSSGLFPFSVMGWPEQTKDLEKYFPGELLETGNDIIFFWVARMVMMSLELMDCLPFKEVLFHSIVRDAQGRKMSKSLGNIIDPIDVIEGISLKGLNDKLYTYNLPEKECVIAAEGQKKDFPNGIEECGTDAMRFALLAYMTQGHDINLDINRVVGYRNFCNKLWNAFKFSTMNFRKDFKAQETFEIKKTNSRLDQWILHRLNVMITSVQQWFKSYEFGNATQAIYSFWLYDFCDVYLEASKGIFRGPDNERRRAAEEVLYNVIEIGLRVLHPFMPFITEELWQRLPRRNDKEISIMVTSYPEPIKEFNNPALDEEIKYIYTIIKGIRSLNGIYSQAIITSKQKPKCTIVTERDLEGYEVIISSLAGIGEVNIVKEGIYKGSPMHVVDNSTRIYSHLAGIIDYKQEAQRLAGKKEQMEKNLKDLELKINDVHFDKTPEEVKKTILEKKQSLIEEIKLIHQAQNECLEMLH
ncbi:valine--tRNA ligase, putative [Entamoeba histolytica HM-1:IMSS-B]|uniref:valine--tRNA ligase n=5 Tax=Entamoeba histolytica TaxID=5759 RepID=C4M431_ENTH1|nr:valyl-tRNA synthetase, putative [Entamoeba histolytica HM-1:IMSS]EMD47465.1 valyl tRNA synthetase, putative [Entamoeba histolytica KU27]EMH75217.1 valine--tRNA ligase, putative [Entamoeba histolytica HM-1:IMSS-B]ENY64697.1 valyl tRNA synthetase, putative [Entamoeba histolytica HM-1:IMSS-A]GAT96105.1 valyl-tRNA synthetase putative [Entamoeba histolytica]EAL45265.1 valyl-tRNA synthetase, putative [Entamoeba histolytica HM-1:IMSS]|eukprot:XP_650652.1 valyl-tRNA synthetase, putative [Entamoeba histolytica HM-1:IMSS]